MTSYQKLKALERIQNDMIQLMGEYSSSCHTCEEHMKILGEAARTLYVVSDIIKELTGEKEAE